MSDFAGGLVIGLIVAVFVFFGMNLIRNIDATNYELAIEAAGYRVIENVSDTDGNLYELIPLESAAADD